MSKLRILHTSDTHGYITSKSFIKDGYESFGLDRVSTLLKEYRNEHTLVIDTGDTIQGSPFTQFYKSNFKQYSNPIAKVYNHLKYDYYIPGNHDFNYGLDYLNDFVSNIDAKSLCNNVYKDNELYFQQGYDIVEINGINVLIIGLTNNYIPHWEQPFNIEGLTFQNAFDSLNEALPLIQKENNIDVTVVAYHGGFEKNLETLEQEKGNPEENYGIKMLQEIKGIDIILTGHQHRVISNKINGVEIVQPGHNASYLSVIDIDINNIQSKLIKTDTAQIDQSVLALVEEEYNACDTYLDQVIGRNTGVSLKIEDPLHSRLIKHPVVQFINEVQLSVTDADISGASLGNTVTGFNDVITYRDVLNTYIFPNTLVILEISGKKLKEYLHVNAQFFALEDNEIAISKDFLYPKLELYNYDMFDGLEYEILVQDKVTVRNVIFQNKEVQDSDILKLVINSYRHSGGDVTGIISSCKKIKEISLDIREILINYIIDKQEINIKHNKNIKVTKK